MVPTDCDPDRFISGMRSKHLSLSIFHESFIILAPLELGRHGTCTCSRYAYQVFMYKVLVPVGVFLREEKWLRLTVINSHSASLGSITPHSQARETMLAAITFDTLEYTSRDTFSIENYYR